jgi:hypothetical protein
LGRRCFRASRPSRTSAKSKQNEVPHSTFHLSVSVTQANSISTSQANALDSSFWAFMFFDGARENIHDAWLPSSHNNGPRAYLRPPNRLDSSAVLWPDYMFCQYNYGDNRLDMTQPYVYVRVNRRRGPAEKQTGNLMPGGESESSFRVILTRGCVFYAENALLTVCFNKTIYSRHNRSNWPNPPSRHRPTHWDKDDYGLVSAASIYLKRRCNVFFSIIFVHPLAV